MFFSTILLSVWQYHVDLLMFSVLGLNVVYLYFSAITIIYIYVFTSVSLLDMNVQNSNIKLITSLK